MQPLGALGLVLHAAVRTHVRDGAQVPAALPCLGPLSNLQEADIPSGFGVVEHGPYSCPFQGSRCNCQGLENGSRRPGEDEGRCRTQCLPPEGASAAHRDVAQLVRSKSSAAPCACGSLDASCPDMVLVGFDLRGPAQLSSWSGTKDTSSQSHPVSSHAPVPTGQHRFVASRMLVVAPMGMPPY